MEPGAKPKQLHSPLQVHLLGLQQLPASGAGSLTCSAASVKYLKAFLASRGHSHA